MSATHSHYFDSIHRIIQLDGAVILHCECGEAKTFGVDAEPEIQPEIQPEPKPATIN